MPKYVWTTRVEIEAESEEDSYIELIDMDCHDFAWEIEDIEDKEDDTNKT